MTNSRVVQPNKYALYMKNLPIAFAGLALVSSAIFDVGNMAYLMYPIAFSMCAIIMEYDNIKKAGLGAKWCWIPLLIIWISALAHLQLAGISFATWFFAAYLLGRTVGSKCLIWVVYGAIVASVFIIISKITIYATGAYGILDGRIWFTHHLAAFLILMGIVLAKPSKLRNALWIIGIPAIVLSGSQEALVVLPLLVFFTLLKKNSPKWILVPLGGFIALIVLTGFAHAAYFNLDAQRFTSLDNILDNRVTPITDLLKSYDWIWGTGYHWSTLPTTVHNVPLKIASQIGIVAGLAWLFMIVVGFFKTPYKWAFAIMLWIGLIDHSLWTEMAIWSPMILGIATAKEKYYEQVQTIKE